MTGQEIRAAVIGLTCRETLPPETGQADTWPERLADSIRGIASRLRQWRRADSPDRKAVRLAQMEESVSRATDLVGLFSSAVDKRCDGWADGEMTFAARLKALRVQQGLTQQQLAERAGILQPALARIEGGRFDPKWSTVCLLADVLGVSVAAFRGE